MFCRANEDIQIAQSALARRDINTVMQQRKGFLFYKMFLLHLFFVILLARTHISYFSTSTWVNQSQR